MSESSSRGSEIQSDNSVGTDDDFLSRKKSVNGINSVRVSVKKNDDGPAIRENFETSKHRSISREIDLGAAVAKLKQDNGELTRESWMKRDTSNFIGDIIEFQEAHFVTGSSYEGSWDSLGMNGVGKYVMPNGTIYEGEIRDGMFHGQGSLYWPNNGRLDVVHYRGELKDSRYTFHDGFVHEENNWNYCKFPDRRFFESIEKGLRPGGRTLKTGRQPNKVLPFGCYDTGDGVFDPKTMRITSYDDSQKVLRLPLKDEHEWIIKKCRKSWSEPTGYRPDLNENWSENPPKLPYNIAMSKDSPDPSWQRLTTFQRDPNFLSSGSGTNSDQSESRLSPDVCLCGQYVILGEPCYCAPISGTSEAGEYQDSEKMSEKDFSEFSEESSEYTSTESTSDYEKIDATSRDRLKKINVIEKIEQSQIEREIPKIDLDFSSRISREFFEDSFSDESMKENPLTRKKSKDKEFQPNENNGKGVVKEQSPEKSREKSNEDETRVGVIETQELQKFSEKSNEEPVDVIENQEVQKFSEISSNGNIDQMKNEMGDKISKKVAEKRHEAKEVKPDFVEEKIFQKSAEESFVKKLEVPTKILDEEMLNKNEKKLSKSSSYYEREISLGKPDHETVPREKVFVITEPEVPNDRRSETKLLPKEIVDKHQDHSESEIVQKKSQPESKSDEETKEYGNKIVKSSMDEDKINDDKIILASLRMEKKMDEKMDENIKSQSDDGKVKDFLSDELSDEMTKMRSQTQLELVKEKSIDESDKKLEKNHLELKKMAEDDFSSLDKVHPSLATLLSTEGKKLSREQEIIEIYQGKPKGKPKIDSTTGNVWRLSGINQGYGPKTKIEDLLFHPALTAPRSENIEYVRKRCDFRVCRPTIREVRPNACRCRKEIDIPAKSVQSSSQKIINGKK